MMEHPLHPAIWVFIVLAFIALFAMNERGEPYAPVVPVEFHLGR